MNGRPSPLKAGVFRLPLESGQIMPIYMKKVSRFWPLLIVVFIELALFAGLRYADWRSPGNKPWTDSGEGFMIRGDGLGYYAWLRSLMIDGDFSFANEFDEHNPMGDCVPGPRKVTELGYRINTWSVGPACIWALSVVPGHLCLLMLRQCGWTLITDGYSFPYQMLVGSTTLLVSL